MKKKLLRIFFAFIMFFSIVPTERMAIKAANVTPGTRIYLKPSTNWKSDNARFAVYFYNKVKDPNSSATDYWYSMTKDNKNTGYYYCDMPSGYEYKNLIFCRMNPSNSTNNWNNKWNQSGNLTWDGTKSVFTVPSNSWDNFTATWSAITYSVQYNSNSGSGSMDNSTHTYGTSKALTANKFTREGYTFTGWNTKNDGTGTSYADKASVDKLTQVLNETVVLYAQWTINQYTISFDTNDGSSVAAITQNYATKVTKPTDPTKKGYTFDGWYSESGLTNKYTFSTMPAKNITLYAKWTANKYTVILDNQEATDPGTANVTATYDSDMPSITAPTKKGKVFAGYYTGTNGAGDQYYGANGQSTRTWNIATDKTTLYAYWIDPVSHTLTLHLCGGTYNESTDDIIHTVNETLSYDFPTPTPTRTGYTFDGWFTNNEYSGNPINSNDIVPQVGSGNLGHYDLYAKWTPINYKITFVENDGSTVADITEGYETVITKPTDPTKTGYTFGGWFTDNNTFENEFIFDTMPLNGATLYAKWIAKTYSVTLDKQGGEGGTSSFTATYGVKTSIDAPTKEGYTFNGYWTSPNGQGTQMYYETGSAYRNWNIDSDTTLYAKWTANVCNLNFNLNYADSPANPDAVNVTYNQIMNLPVPTRTGYTFLGWNTDPSGTGTYYRNGEICKITAGSNILYAIWEVKVYNIEINLDGGSILNQNLPSSYTIETESFNIPTPKKDGWTFEGWYDGNNLYKTVSFTQGVTIDDKSYTAIWTQKITIIVNLSDLTSANVNNVYVHFWGTGTGPGWKDPIEKMQLVDANEKKYQLDIVFASSNTSLVKTCGLTEIKNVILAYTETSGTFPGDKKTEDMIVSPTITAADNGKIYKFKFEGSVWENSTLTNATFGEIITLTYMDGDVVKYTEEITTKEAIQHKFYEKEGFKLEGWYEDPSFTGERHENGITTSVSLTLYAHYVPADDFYLYIDTTELTAWEITHVYFWSNYFAAHDNSWPGTDTGIIDLKNGIIQIHVDASKSYDALILNDGTNQTVDITLSPQNVYYSVKNTKKAETEKYEIVYEKCLDNIMIAQKMTGDVNAFRFGTGLPTSITDLSSSNKNFGYKFIFVDEDTRNSFVGYWNFSTSNKLDAFRVGNILYKSNELDQTSDYAGFYALTLTDDVTFKYENYDKIVVIACYKDNKNVIQVIKAQEYDIHIDGEGNVSLTSIQR